MNFFDKIKTYYKEHRRDIIKICKIIFLSVCLLVMLFSCAVDTFAIDISLPAPVTDDVTPFALPDDYNIIPVGTYTIRYNELDFSTYPLSSGIYDFRCICEFGVLLTDTSSTLLSSRETVQCFYQNNQFLFFNVLATDFSYLYRSDDYGWNALLTDLAGTSSSAALSLSYVPLNLKPFFTVPTEQNVGYEFGAFFHNNFVLVDDISSVECPTIQELLTEYPDADMSTLLAETKPNWFNENNQEYLNAGFEAGYTAGSNETAELLEGTFLGDVVGGILDAIDQLVLYSNGDVTITMLTAVRSVFAALFVMWILKLIAGG